jgi:hypothetical protein
LHVEPAFLSATPSVEVTWQRPTRSDIMLRLFALASLLAVAQSLQLPAAQQSTTRRGAIAAAGAALAVRVLPAGAAIQDPINMLSLKNPSAAAKEVLTTQELLNAFVKNEEAFVMGQVDADEKAPQLPRAIPFTTFQSLEKDAGPEFMEIAIDYAEAMRNARDLTKLAKLTKQKVSISSKEPGKPRVTMEIEYGLAEGSNLGSTKEYAGRAFQEAIGANIALNAAVDALPKKK